MIPRRPPRNRGEYVGISLTAPERQAWVAAAKARKLDLRDFVRAAVGQHILENGPESARKALFRE